MTSIHLRPCPSCARHVRVNEGGCPFCGAALAGHFDADRPSLPPATRLSRAALFALGTGAASVAAACGGSTTDEQHQVAPPYGAFPFPEAGSPDGSGNDGGAPDADSGGGELDATTPDAGSNPPDAGSPEDSSFRDAPNIAPPYGLPPGHEDESPPESE
jgi:hypothetical protein